MPFIPEHMVDDVDGWLDFTRDASSPQSPVSAAAQLLQKAYEAYPNDEAVAFLLADLRLAHDLKWPHSFPLFGQRLAGKELAFNHEEFLIECNRAIAAAAQDAVRKSHDLALRSKSLMAIAPKLRAKGADEALHLFLSEVAVSPSSMLSPMIKGTNTPMTARAARRFCDRLVELDVVKELTGRPTFVSTGWGHEDSCAKTRRRPRQPVRQRAGRFPR